MKNAGNSLLIGGFLILIAILSRLLPHWHNFTAVGATGLFGAYYFRKQIWAYTIPLIAMWLSDLLLNNWVYAAFNEGFVWFSANMIFVYLGFMAMVFFGSKIITKISSSRIVTASVLTSGVFFLISNFGAFVIEPIYPKNGAGLLLAYGAGIPFFWSTLLSNLLYSILFFGVFSWAFEKVFINSTNH